MSDLELRIENFLMKQELIVPGFLDLDFFSLEHTHNHCSHWIYR